MEDMYSKLEEKDLQLLEESKSYVRSIGQWQMFFAVLLSVGVGFMFLCGLFFFTPILASMLDEDMGGIFVLIGIFYIVVAALYLVPTIYLFRASSAARDAALCKDNYRAVEFLKNNKSFWKYSGIITIATFVLYILFAVALIAIVLIAGVEF